MGLTIHKLKKSKVVSSLLGVLRESMMIVLGILLALQIDSWVSERAETNNLKSNLNYVLEDISNNKAALLRTKDEEEKSVFACTELIDAYKQHHTMHSKDIVITLRSILKTNKFVIDQSGFERIKASPLYESNDFFEVRDKIRQYNGILTDLRFTENFINSYISSLSHEMSKNGALLSVFDYIRMQRDIAQYKADVPHFEVDEILSGNKPLQAVLHKYEFDAPVLIEHYVDLLALGEELEEVINLYLND